MKSKIKQILSMKMMLALFDVIFKYIPINAYVRLFNQQEDCWLIAERKTDARDNGFVFFKWMRENHPQKRVIYVIDKSCSDYQNVKDLGEVIEYGSLKHWYYYLASHICCDTNAGICAPNSMCYLLMRNIFPPTNKRVFLQHGITKDYMSMLRKEKIHVDIFVCGAYPEWEYITKKFGYTDGEPKYLGFTRFDRLNNTASSNQILFMPTWRASLDGCDNIEKTVYFNNISALLSSNRLNTFLEESDTELVFFLHPHIRGWKHYFKTFANKHIKVLNNEDYDLQKFICSANILITDYSSIYFDFAYQDKPVVYYQFDYDDYRLGHYAEGYFNYDNDGFGPVLKTNEDVIKCIEELYRNHWNNPENYSKRIERFFPLRDKNNCLRHYNEIIKLENK